MENGICATVTSRLVRPVLHYVALGYRARDLSWELCNALWHHLTQQQLDPSTSYKKKLLQYSLYGHHGRSNKETEEERKRGRESKPRTGIFSSPARAKSYKRMQVRCWAGQLSVGLLSNNRLTVLLFLVLQLFDVWLCFESCRLASFST